MKKGSPSGYNAEANLEELAQQTKQQGEPKNERYSLYRIRCPKENCSVLREDSSRARLSRKGSCGPCGRSLPNPGLRDGALAPDAPISLFRSGQDQPKLDLRRRLPTAEPEAANGCLVTLRGRPISQIEKRPQPAAPELNTSRFIPSLVHLPTHLIQQYPPTTRFPFIPTKRHPPAAAKPPKRPPSILRYEENHTPTTAHPPARTGHPRLFACWGGEGIDGGFSW